jgi:flavin-dependent dehydrogenase
VIGAGINGAVVGHECARGRKRVLVVEKSDFASGTTSRSTRIIHGGPVALGPCWSPECARTAAHRIGKALVWSDRQTGAELNAFEEEFGNFLLKPATRAL